MCLHWKTRFVQIMKKTSAMSSDKVLPVELIIIKNEPICEVDASESVNQDSIVIKREPDDRDYHALNFVETQFDGESSECNGLDVTKFKTEPDTRSARENQISNVAVKSETDGDISEESCSDSSTHISDTISISHPHIKKFKCDLCPSNYTHLKHLRAHIRLHSGEGVLSCEQCDRKFTYASDLVRHTRVHTGEKPYVCTVCGKGFSISCYVRTHKCIPPEKCNKNFKCDSCPCRFTDKKQLGNHKRLHSGERVFTCDECGKIFTFASYLERHKWTHSGEKPHICTVCGKRFSRAYNLKGHDRLHQRVCNVCHKWFTSADAYNKNAACPYCT